MSIARGPLLGLLLFLSGIPGLGLAAESYDNCTGFIDSVPAVISTQGTWCLRQDLTTSIASGAAITVATNNVTLDCNDFKIGGLAAGLATRTIGVNALARSNIILRNCSIRGFWYGVNLEGPAMLVEDNRFDGNTWVSLGVEGDGGVVRRNRVLYTGGTTSTGSSILAVGIFTRYNVDVRENLVVGASAPVGSNGSAIGINPGDNLSGTVADNKVTGIVADGTGWAYGISLWGTVDRVMVRANEFVGDGAERSVAVSCPFTNKVTVLDNSALGWSYPTLDYQCFDADSPTNYYKP